MDTECTQLAYANLYILWGCLGVTVITENIESTLLS
jgi:hypothetical protein